MTRKLAPFVIIVILVLLTIYFSIRLLLIVTSLETTTPKTTTPTIAINPIFNKIKPPRIIEAGTSGNFTYVLDTLDGTTNVENATTAASVYFFKKPAATFGFLDEIYTMAKTVDIDTDITKHVLKDRIAQFDDGRKKLEIDIDTFNFSYEYYLDRDEELFNRELGNLGTQVDSVATNFLGKMGKYNRELAQGKRNTIYLRYEKDTRKINTLEAAEGANMVELDFYRPDIGMYPVVTSTYFNSPHYVMVAPKGNQTHVVRAKISYFETATDQVGVYPLRTGDKALEDLKGGKGLVISSPQPDGEVKIKKIFLAYYEPDFYQEYMHPVYVFLGENKFVAYVLAVTDEYLLLGE